MSLRRDRLSWLFIGFLLVAVMVTAYFVVWPQLQPHTTLRVGDGVFTARVFMPDVAQDRAATTSNPLRKDRAVVRVYAHDELWPVDMQDRQGTFDVVWLDKDKKIVHIVKNASADSVPSTSFQPATEARYMIELRGGTVDEKSLRIDSTAHFDEHNLRGLKL